MMNKILKCDPLLLCLFQAKEELSIEDLARKLSSSVTKIEDRLQQLQNQGFTILKEESNVSILTVNLEGIVPEKIASDLKFPIDVYYLDQSISTNTLAMDLDPTSPAILFTKEQTAGKGRAGREWFMQREKDIALTFSLPMLGISETQFSSLIYLSSLAVFRTLDFFAPDHFMIKWPNDIMTQNGQKISGILINSVIKDLHCQRVIVGIGVNINSDQFADYAVSLKQVAGQEFDINAVYAKLINTFLEYWYHFSTYQHQLQNDWQEHLCWIGELVSFQEHDKQHVGIFKRVDFDGSVIIEIDGQEHHFRTGDLTQFRLTKNS
ncbi:MAG: biotin--[acetyl-CoA-carboxylase] ligase [Brevinema sp.]